jgi:phage/plasmid primase-like uncharacterized protein
MESIYPAFEKVKAPPISEILPDLQQTRRREKHGPCWRCGGEDRFIEFENGRGWCRQCGWKGDAIQLLRDRDKLSFSEAKHVLGLDHSPVSRQIRARAKAHSFALATAKTAFFDWRRQRLIELTELYRILVSEQKVAEIAYRAIHRRPDLYTDEEQRFWTHTLASIYDRITALEHDLDILTCRENEEACFTWWQGEGRRDG